MKKRTKPFSAEIINEIAGEIMSDDFCEAWKEYVLMRDEYAKTRITSDNSQKRILKQLLGFSADNEKRLQSLYQSTDLRYRGFFQIKNDYLKNYKKAKYVQNESVKHSIQELSKDNEPVIKEKFSVRDKVRERAKNGCQASIALVRKWDNPKMAQALKEHEEVQKKLKIKKLVQEDEKKGIFARIS